jgi:hypothetical protein
MRGFSSLTDEAGLHGSVKVVGEGVEDAAPLHLEGLVHDALDDFHHLVVAELVACVAWRKKKKMDGWLQWGLYIYILH